MNTPRIHRVKSSRATCPKCGASEHTIRSYSDTIDFRGLELDVESLQNSKCKSCGHVWTTKDQAAHNQAIAKIAYATERDRLRTLHGLLSGPEIARVRHRLGLTQRQAATYFGGGFNAFNKYESGEVLQSFAMDRLLRLADLIGPAVIEFLADVWKTPTFKVIHTLPATVNVLPGTIAIDVAPHIAADDWHYETGTNVTLAYEWHSLPHASALMNKVAKKTAPGRKGQRR